MSSGSGLQNGAYQHHFGSGQANPLDLDLSSTTASMRAGHLFANGPVDIQVGNTTMSVERGMSLTPGEYLAAIQVARTGQQSLLLDDQGSATGGTAVIGQHLSQMLSNLLYLQMSA